MAICLVDFQDVHEGLLDGDPEKEAYFLSGLTASIPVDSSRGSGVGPRWCYQHRRGQSYLFVYFEIIPCKEYDLKRITILGRRFNHLMRIRFVLRLVKRGRYTCLGKALLAAL